MGALYYSGAPSVTGRGLETAKSAEAVLLSGVSRSSVTGRVAELAAPYASLVYVNNQDSQYAPASAYAAGDATLIPKTALGANNGVASLNVSGKIPTEQVPVLGAGMLRGPFGHKEETPAVTGTTRTKIADLFTGTTGVTGLLLAFMQVGVKASGGRPIVEIRAGNSTQTTWDTQTLIAAGVGREFYTGDQLVSVLPAPDTTGMGQGSQVSWPANTDLLVQAWMYSSADSSGAVGQVEYEAQRIFTCSLFLAKTQL
jgi:hypothetical protein